MKNKQKSNWFVTFVYVCFFLGCIIWAFGMMLIVKKCTHG